MLLVSIILEQYRGCFEHISPSVEVDSAWQVERKAHYAEEQLGLKKLYQVLVVLENHADNSAAHRKTGDGVLDTLFIRGEHLQLGFFA